MELGPYFPRSKPIFHHPSVLSQPHFLCRRRDPPFSGLPLDNTMEYVHNLAGTTREDVWDIKDLERISKGQLVNDIDMQPFMKIDDETIQHFSHDHLLILYGSDNSCGHENKFCQGCCLPLISSERFYVCMQCDFVLHEACAYLPHKKKSPLHKHPLTLHPFPIEPKFEAYVKGMFACDGCEQLNCGFVYKCHEKDCEFQLDVRCASLSNPLIHENHHQLDHPLFLTKTRGVCMSCKSSKCSPYLLECRKCNFVLGLKCATLPCVVQYKHDNHPLTLCYGKENTRNLQYKCEKCDLEIEERTWFYAGDSCKVKLHVKCLLGRDIYLKPDHIININDHEEVEIVRNDGSSQAFCYVCGKRCVDSLIFKWLDRYSCSFLCIVTFFL